MANNCEESTSLKVDSETPKNRRRWSRVWSSSANQKETVQAFESMLTPKDNSAEDDVKRKRRSSAYAICGNVQTDSYDTRKNVKSPSDLATLINYYGQEFVRYRTSNEVFKRIMHMDEYLHIYFVTFTILSLNHGTSYILHYYPRTDCGRNLMMPFTIDADRNMSVDCPEYSENCLIRYPIDEVPNSIRLSIVPSRMEIGEGAPFVEERKNELTTNYEDEMLSEAPLMTELLHLESRNNREIPLVASSNGVVRLYLKPPFDKHQRKTVPLGILTLRMEYKQYPAKEINRQSKYDLLNQRRRLRKQEQVPNPQGFAIASNSILVERRRRRNSCLVTSK